MSRYYLISALTALLLLSSCVGYKLGSAKPVALQGIKNISVPLVTNETLEIKLAPLATNALVSSISNDGSYRISKPSNSDAYLKATIKKIDYREFRSARLDTLRAEELTMNVIVAWELIANSGEVLLDGVSTGNTRFFSDNNQRISRDNAVANALQNAASKITSRISNGF